MSFGWSGAEQRSNNIHKSWSAAEQSRTGTPGEPSPSRADLLHFWGPKQSCNTFTGGALPCGGRVVTIVKPFPGAEL